VLIDNPERWSSAIEGLHALGVRIALDDSARAIPTSATCSAPARQAQVDRSFVIALGNSAMAG